MIFGIGPRCLRAPNEAGGGGGSTPPRIIRPNLELIVKLRGGALAGPRPLEIRKIGVIDDEAMLVRTVQRSFRDISPVEEIKEPREIISKPDLLNALGFDAVFIDHDMPYINGSEVMRLARENGFSGFLFGMTGRIDKNMPLFYSAGADLVLAKPFEIKLEELVAL
jgi:CheY-like chemotaxis protein